MPQLRRTGRVRVPSYELAAIVGTGDCARNKLMIIR
jgi:hypothetical protein